MILLRDLFPLPMSLDFPPSNVGFFSNNSSVLEDSKSKFVNNSLNEISTSSLALIHIALQISDNDRVIASNNEHTGLCGDEKTSIKLVYTIGCQPSIRRTTLIQGDYSY